MRRVSIALMVASALALGAPAAGWAATGMPSQVGRWGDVLQWPLQAKHMILLHTGKVLVWASQANADPHLWDPVADPTGEHMRPVPFPFGDLHCAAQVTLADGRVMIVGGQNVNTHIGIPVTAIFDPVSETWTRGADMRFARWYPTLTLMADGRALVSSGDQGTAGRVDTPEIYDPATDTWTDAAKPVNTQYLYPFLYQLPGGTVFEAGTRAQTQFFDPLGGTDGLGSWTAGRVAPFGTDSYSESGAMYAPGKIVRAGGGDPAQAETAVIDTNVADPTKAQWRLTAPMNHPRRRMNTPLLLDGTMLAVGGTAVGNNPSGAVESAEIWDPATELWTEVADMAEPRMYHSTALTLPDGRVVSAGGQVTVDGATEDNPSSTSLQLTAQIFEPPYLFHGPRPAITAAPGESAYDADLPLTLGDARAIAKVGLLRPSGVTHAIDMNQRYVPLDFQQNGAQITAKAPTSPYRAVPGYYMVIATDTAGVPSAARWIRLGNGQPTQDPGAPAPITPAATVPATASIRALSPTTIQAGEVVSFASSWTGPPTSFAWTFGDGTGSGAAHPNHRFLLPGTYTVQLTVKNAKTPTGFASNTITVTVLGDDRTPPPDPGVDAPAPAPAPGPEATMTTPQTVGGTDQGDAPSAPRRVSFSPTALGSASVRRPSATLPGLQALHGRGAGGDRRRAYLRFVVRDLGAAPARAVLRLHVADASSDGGSVFATAAGAASFDRLSWTGAPATRGAAVAAAGATAAGAWVSLDVTRAVAGDGPVGFALVSTSQDAAAYSASGPDAPQLVVTPAARAGAAPAADFAAAPRRGTGRLTVAFTDHSVGATSWAWDFDGDGHVDSTARDPRFTYTRAGTFTVRLTARNAAGEDVAVAERLIVVDRPGAARAVRRFPAIADATIISTSPRRTAAAGAQLAVRQGDETAPQTSRSYLRFRVSGLRGVPASAKLRLYVKGAGADGGSVFAVTDRWTESRLAWSTAPGIAVPSLASAGAVAAGTWIELDVTRGVAGNGPVSFALATTTAAAVAYASREDRAHRPELVVTAAKGSTARQAAVRRAHLASLLAPRPMLLCPLA